MECLCEIDIEVTDFAKILFGKVVKSKKTHRCHECGVTIKAGDKYYKEKTLYDGIFSIHKTCMDCKSIRDNLFCSFCWGDIREAVMDSILDNDGKISEDCLSKLTPKAREWVCGVIESTWNDDE